MENEKIYKLIDNFEGSIWGTKPLSKEELENREKSLKNKQTERKEENKYEQ